jgi:hypothetical protein
MSAIIHGSDVMLQFGDHPTMPATNFGTNFEVGDPESYTDVAYEGDNLYTSLKPMKIHVFLELTKKWMMGGGTLKFLSHFVFDSPTRKATHIPEPIIDPSFSQLPETEVWLQ